MTFFVVSFDKDHLSAYFIVLSIMMAIYTIANGIGVTTNVLLSSLLGINSPSKSKKLSFYLLIYGNTLGILIIIIVLIFKSFIIGLIETNEKVVDIANGIFFWSMINIFLEISCSIYYSIFISVNKYYLVMFLYLSFNILSYLCILLMIKVVIRDIEAVFIGAMIARIIMLIVYFLIYKYLIDWDECCLNIQNTINTEHLEEEDPSRLNKHKNKNNSFI